MRRYEVQNRYNFFWACYFGLQKLAQSKIWLFFGFFRLKNKNLKTKDNSFFRKNSGQIILIMLQVI